MKIRVENSTWNNVGDGWYQTSLYGLLRKTFPQHQVLLGEGPIRRAFRIGNNRQLNNALNVMDYEKADIHVFSGPMISAIIRDYSVAIKRIIAAGENYVLLSASGTGLSPSVVAEIGQFLTKYPPLLLSTRDEETYNNFKSYVPNSYNGICTAFLVDRTIELDTFELEKPFFISSFYTELEPTFSLKKKGDGVIIGNIDLEHHKTLFGLPFKYSRHLDFLRKHQSELENHLIVRTVQNLNTRFNHINFSTPNSFISFNPVRYLEVAKSAEFTISDRVHACAISLACNHPARFLFNTPRAGIFDRLGFDYKSNGGIMHPNMQRIDEEMGLFQDVLKKFIG